MLFKRRSTVIKDRKVLVNLLSGNALAGVCVYDGPRVLTLRGVTVHEPGADPMAADGDVLVDRINIDFIQVP